MMWILVATIGLIIVLVGFATYIKGSRKEGRPKGAGFGEGLVIGMLACAVIFIALSELGGYHDVYSYWLPSSLVVGAVLGYILERRYQKQ